MPTTSLKDLQDDLTAKCKTIVGDAFPFYNSQQLAEMQTKVSTPAIAIVYLGRVGDRTTRNGKMALSRFALYVMGDKIPCAGTDGSAEIKTLIDTLDAIKDVICGKDSPHGHPWEFHSEVPFQFKAQGKELPVLGRM